MDRYFDDLSLGTLELFCQAARLESFSRAASVLGLTPPAVSRTIARLEARLGVPLFVRTTRKVRLTEAGKTYQEHCERAIEQIAQAEQALSGQHIAPSGTVRISMPTSYGHHRVLPLLAEFRQQFPGVSLELQLANHNVDFIGDGFDLAIRGRPQPDSTMVVRQLEVAALVVVASPSYLGKRGSPSALADLSAHECLHFVLPRNGQQVPWVFHVNGREETLAPPGGISCSGDILGPLTLAREGAGLVQTYRFLVEEDLRQGRLREVLSSYAGPARPFSLLYPRAQYLPRKCRVLVDFLIERLQRPVSRHPP